MAQNDGLTTQGYVFVHQTYSNCEETNLVKFTLKLALELLLGKDKCYIMVYPE